MVLLRGLIFHAGVSVLRLLQKPCFGYGRWFSSPPYSLSFPSTILYNFMGGGGLILLINLSIHIFFIYIFHPIFQP
jgi:hypothetical protein